LDDAVWEQIIKEVDTNGDGVISKEEFTTMMLKYADVEQAKEEAGNKDGNGGSLWTFVIGLYVVYLMILFLRFKEKLNIWLGT